MPRLNTHDTQCGKAAGRYAARSFGRAVRDGMGAAGASLLIASLAGAAWPARPPQPLPPTAPLAAPQAQVASQTAPGHAHQLIAQAIAALGGETYLKARNMTGMGQIYTYNGEGEMNGYGMRFWSFSSFPGKQRLELTRKRDVIYIYNGLKAWQVTYRGVTPLNAKQMRRYENVDEHSLGRVLRQWVNTPGTLILDRGLTQGGARQVEQVDLISPQNHTVHLQLDLFTHLPERLIWRKRDPYLGTFVRQMVVFGNYQRIQGVMTPMMVQRFDGTQPVEEQIYYQVQYPASLPANLFVPPKKLPKG